MDGKCDETICSYQIDGKCAFEPQALQALFDVNLTMFKCNGTWCWVGRLRHHRPVLAEQSKGIASVKEGDGRRPTFNGGQGEFGGQAQQRRSKERQRRCK